jgi:hypothetical protein
LERIGDDDGGSRIFQRPAAAKKGSWILERLCARQSSVLRHLGDTRAEAMALQRFFRNPKVTAAEIVASAAAQTAAAAHGRHVLLIEDTSEINYEAKSGRKRGLGTVGNGSDAGLFIHPALAVDADDGTVLGLAGATIWQRTKAKAATYQSDPIETKESFRWLDTVGRARADLAAAPVVTVVADREADIYELFARLPKTGPAETGPAETGPGLPHTHLIVRCNHDRALVDEAGRRAGRLDETVSAWTEAGTTPLDVPARPGRSARRATLGLRFGRLRLRQPRTGADPRDPPDVTLNLVEVCEADPPEGETPIRWRLYTTHAVATPEQALAIVALYRQRWLVEQVFRILKSQGLGIEDSGLAEADALENLVAASLIAAIRVLQCVQGRAAAGAAIPARRVFAEHHIPALAALARQLQGKTAKQKNPFPPESLAWATWVIARLGGWTGYASERPPGPITIHNGLVRFEAIAIGFALAHT